MRLVELKRFKTNVEKLQNWSWTFLKDKQDEVERLEAERAGTASQDS